jgi:hypothetical protein
MVWCISESSRPELERQYFHPGRGKPGKQGINTCTWVYSGWLTVETPVEIVAW